MNFKDITFLFIYAKVLPFVSYYIFSIKKEMKVQFVKQMLKLFIKKQNKVYFKTVFAYQCEFLTPIKGFTFLYNDNLVSDNFCN